MLINDPAALAAFCAQFRGLPFLTIDTEFLRDKTYYPQLCLIQMAGPGIAPAAIDPFGKDGGGLDLTPVFDLMDDPSIVKVFHAARQDLEIFFNLTGRIPAPLFDSQVAAMVCGFGDQIGYYNLVQDVCQVRLDKAAQFTDWARRPLSAAQMSYALDDVTYLRDVYLKLDALLREQGREDWVTEELEFLTSPATYQMDPENAWQRIKLRTDKPKTLAVLKETAAWREREAQERNVPRGRIIKDEVLADLALHAPQTPKELAEIRGFSADMARGRTGQAVLAAVARGLAMPRDQMPVGERKKQFPPDMGPTLEMLKMLLRIQCGRRGVAAKLVADSDDLETLALEGAQADVPCMQGWRRTVFGDAALDMMRGRIALTLDGGKVTMLRWEDGEKP